MSIAGTMGLKANLTGGEIVEQLVYASQIAKVRNVVFMGMGEPLDNYTSVKVRCVAPDRSIIQFTHTTCKSARNYCRKG
jgi:adenine C2-methylase RlmN of 23S rRNA A2503 and tRNA A37